MDELATLLGEISGGNTLVFVIMGGVLLMTSGICFFVLAGSAGYLTTILSIAASACPVARTKAIGNPFVREGRLNELFESGMLSDALARIQAEGYDISSLMETGGRAIDEILEQKELEEFPALLLSVPPDFEIFFSRYERLYEIRMIKRLIRMIHGNSHPGAIIKSVQPIGMITTDLISRIAGGSDLEDSLHHLRATPYEFLTAEPLHQYRQQGTILPLELALDRFGSDQLRQAAALVNSHLAAPFRDLVSVMIDVQNIRTLIRAKHAGLAPTWIAASFLEGGARIPHWRLIQLNEMMSVPDLIGQLSGTNYQQILQPLLHEYPGTDSLVRFDIALDRFILSNAARISLVYYYTGGPLIWFIIAKQYEYRNLQVILTGLAQGADPELIRRFLVIDTGAA